MHTLIRCAVAVIMVAVAYPAPAAPLLITTEAGDLVFEVLSGEGGASTQEFGLGSPTLSTPPALRNTVFVITLNGSVSNVAPSTIRNMGFFSAGSALDFYNISDFGGTQLALSSALDGSPTPSDLVVFRDLDNSLGFGGSIVEVLGPNDWILHMDDAASYAFDDDDNEMVIRVRVVSVPEPSTLALIGAAMVALRIGARRGSTAPLRSAITG